MPEAETILTASPGRPAMRPDGRSAGIPFRELLAWKRRQRAEAIRRRQELSRGAPEVIYIDLDFWDANKQPRDFRLAFNAWEAK
jgi:hypothetical protein